MVLSAGQDHDSRWFMDVLDDARLPKTRVRGRYRPDTIAGDKGYNVEWIREALRIRRIRAVIPRRVPRPHESFDREAYRQRNIVERCIGWLKESRRGFSRFDKLAGSYLAFVKLAVLRRLLKFDFSDSA